MTEKTWDWTQHSAVVVMDLPLWKRPCSEILAKDADLTDPEEPEIYFKELLWNTEDQDPKPICLPTHYKTLIGQLRKQYGYKWFAEPFRRLVLHGLAIHDLTHGIRLHDLSGLDAIQNAIISNNKKILDILSCNIKGDFTAKRCTSVRFNENFYNMIEQRREDAGICEDSKWIAYLVALSLRTHPDLSCWYDDFDRLIADLQRKMNDRIERLESL